MIIIWSLLLLEHILTELNYPYDTIFAVCYDGHDDGHGDGHARGTVKRLTFG